MDFEGALRARLTGAGSITTLTAQRIYWVTRPQATILPAITLQIIDEDREQHFEGFQLLQTVLVQIDIWAATYAQGQTLKEALIAAAAPEVISNGIHFRRAFVRARDLSERTETAFIFRPSLDFTFHYSAQ